MAKRFSLKKESFLLPLLLLGLAALTTAITLLGQDEKPKTEALAQNSVYNNGQSGYKAWFLAAQKSGLPIRTWESSFDELNSLPAPTTMLIVKPFTVSGSNVTFGKKEADKLLQWVAKGNTLVLLDDFSRFGSNALAHRLALKIRRPATTRSNPKKGTKPSPPRRLKITDVDKPLGTYVQGPVISRNLISLNASPQNAFMEETLLTDATGQSLLLKMNYRGGRLILGTTTDLAENQYLKQPPNDNYQLLTNLLKRQNAPIYVNEFVHGYVESGDLMSYFQKKTPLGSIFAQLALFFCLLLWLSFVRWTPKPKERDERPKTENTGGQDAYIQSLAGLYLKSKSASLALGPPLKRMENTLRQRHRIGMDEEARLQDLLTNLFADYSSTEESPAQLLETIQSAKQAVREQSPVHQRDLLKISRQLTLIEERLRHGNRTLSGKR